LEVVEIPIKRIKPAKYNPRIDLQPGDPDYEKLRRSIEEFDCVEPLVWNKKTGNLVGGHQRLKILKERGDEQVDVSVVDLDPVKEKALNLALNKIQGDWDMPMLKDLLEELDTGETDMDITGFDTLEIERLMTQFYVPKEAETRTPTEVVAGEWVGMPEFIQEDLSPVRTLYVHFATHEDVEAFAELVGQTLTPKTRYIWYPKAEVLIANDKRYADES